MSNTTAQNGDMNRNQYLAAVRELGLPTFLVLALGFVMIKYWIEPQTKVLEAQTATSQKLAEVLSEGLEANQEELKKLNSQMTQAYELMADVPEQRTEELKLLKQLTQNSYPDEEFRKQVNDDHAKHSDEINQVLNKLDK